MFILKAEIETVGIITRQNYSGMEISPILDLIPIGQLKSIQTLRLKKIRPGSFKKIIHAS